MPTINIFAGKLQIPLKSEENKPKTFSIHQEVKEPSKVQAMLSSTKPQINPQVTPETNFPNLKVNSKQELTSLLQGLLLSYEGESDYELERMGIPLDKIKLARKIFWGK